MSTYLVTGAAGFIASKVCEQLLALGHSVVGVDNLNDYYDVRLKDYRLGRLLGSGSLPMGDSAKESVYCIRPKMSSNESVGAGTSGKELGVYKNGRFSFHQLDIEDLQGIESLFRASSFDGVINLAARAGVRYSMENPHVYLSTNTQGTLNILECMRKFGVKKHVLASTSSLYAGCAMPFTEELPVNTPLSPYAASKKAAELMAYSYHKLYGLDVTVVRYFTVFGPAGRPDMSVFRFIKWINEGVPIQLYGDGTQSRDFTYVEDIADGTIKALKPLGYEIINLGGGRNPISLQCVIQTLAESIGKQPLIAGGAPHVADIKETWADISKAKRLLNWVPQIAPKDGFEKCVEWYAENSHWLRSIVV